MMQNDDLERVALLVRDLPTPPSAQTPCDLLIHPEGAFWLSDVWRLRRSAECAVHAKQMNWGVYVTLWHLCEALRAAPENARLVGLDQAEAWKLAMATARANSDYTPRVPADKSREQVVGEACRRLVSRGRKLRVRAHGPEWDEASLREACAAIDYLISRLGGLTVTNQCAGSIKAIDRTFEDIWLLGDRGLGMGQLKEPAVPFGWLVGLAARHMHRPNRCRNPATAWRSLIMQACDVAASFDCQRYGQFEGIGGIAPAQIDATVSEAISWRALFFTPQAPRLLLPRLQTAFRKELPRNSDPKTRASVIALIQEMIDLAEHLRSDGCVQIEKAHAWRSYPQLCTHARATKGLVNCQYRVPVRDTARDDTAFVLFDGPRDTFVLRPVAMSIHAFCEALFGLVRKQLGNNAAKTVGNVIETAIADACEGKAGQVWRRLSYGTKRNPEEIDVVARSGDQVTLIEAKAKVLTRNGQVGTSGEFYNDYAQSFLPMVRQLAKHTRHLRAGATPVASAQEASTLEVERIAVSPVSFGPIGDGLTTTALMSALPGVRIHALRADPKAHISTETFNTAVAKTMKELAQAIPKNAEGHHDLFDFFLSTRWLDLGQLLFALDRTDSVDTALQGIKHLTTGSRDFWSEFAFAQSIRS